MTHGSQQDEKQGPNVVLHLVTHFSLLEDIHLHQNGLQSSRKILVL